MENTADQAIYHVVLGGRKVGPYDRRTIIGMRIKNTLNGEHTLIGMDGSRTTVDSLIGQRPTPNFGDTYSGSVSLVHATFTASVLELAGKGVPVPRFRGEIEARVQADVLRMAGRFRQGLGWKEGRIKILLKDIVHARINNSRVDLWLRAVQPGAGMKRLSLELFTPEAAGELVDWFHNATPWPGPTAATRASPSNQRALWLTGAGLAGAVMVILLLIAVALLQGRVY